MKAVMARPRGMNSSNRAAAFLEGCFRYFLLGEVVCALELLEAVSVSLFFGETSLLIWSPWRKHVAPGRGTVISTGSVGFYLTLH